MKHHAVVALALLATLAVWACDALVGGECLPGYAPQGTSCVPSTSSSGHGGAAAGGSSSGGLDGGSGGQGNHATGGSGGSGANGTGGNATGGNGTGNSGNSGTGGSVPCPDGLVWCPPDGCVDLQTNIKHCGACGNSCPTEVCVDGKCQGNAVGHLVVIAMTFAQSSAPTQVLLGNAVFLPPNDPVRILDFRTHSKLANVQHVETIIASEAKKRNRTYGIKVQPIAAVLGQELGTNNYDVLLIHDQPNAIPGVLAATGTTMATAVQTFAKKGGAVVVLASNEGTDQMHQLLTNSNILATNGFGPYSGFVLNKVPSDVVGNSVPSPFQAKSLTTLIDSSEPPSLTVIHVFTDSGSGPIVIHKTVSP